MSVGGGYPLEVAFHGVGRIQCFVCPVVTYRAFLEGPCVAIKGYAPLEGIRGGQWLLIIPGLGL